MSVDAALRVGDCARLHAQRGSLLLEFMVVAVLSLVLAIWAGQEWAQRARALQARSLAAWMGIARDAAEGFLSRHAAQLAGAETADALADQGIADWTAPRWDELRSAGLLSAGWQTTGPLHRTLGLRVMREGECPGGSCRVWALLHARPALRTPAGGVDEVLVAEWLQAAEGRGLVVWPRRPGVLGGAGWHVPVPETGAADWAPGVVALAARTVSTRSGEAGAGGGEDYLRVRDARDPDFQGDATVQGVVSSGTYLAARDGLLLGQGWIVGGPCAQEGMLGRLKEGAGVLACRQGLWELLARPPGGGYMLNSRRGCLNAAGGSSANPVTGTCSCPAGYAMAQVAESGSLVAPEGWTVGYVCVARR
ncbi:hypothetical protein ACFO0J_14910 [Castellaniella hirudinis]|uniref:Prepilin-type N-terminal cleavage/methylation domain-containing protein n=1 Tax=Castellaniella hirudinis TaxID=1144617 RepID=A0ABV8S2L2_9BURK